MANNVSANVLPANAQGVSAVTLPVSDTAKLHKYHATAANVPCANVLFRLGGASDVAGYAATGRNKAGRHTIVALTVFAASKAGATASKAVSGLDIVRVMQTLPEVLEAYGATRAGKYAPKGTVPCPAWCSDYVTGISAARHALLARSAS